MDSQKVVTPVKTGVQGFYNLLKFLDSDFRRNDENGLSATFCETITCYELRFLDENNHAIRIGLVCSPSCRTPYQIRGRPDPASRSFEALIDLDSGWSLSRT